MRILVTGGLGFVGINIVAGLATEKVDAVIAADLLSWNDSIDRFLSPVKERVVYRRLDVRDAEAVREVMAAEKITHVVHAAAITSTAEQEQERAAEIVAVNLHGTSNVLAGALESSTVQRLLVISSSGVYGTPAENVLQPQGEEGPLNLTNLYAITKYSAELLAARYAELSGRLMAAVRLPGIYGPMERRLTSRPHTSAPGLLMEALRAGQHVRVAGPEVTRDWTYAADIPAGLWALFSAPQWHFPVYNLSCGQASSFREVVQAFVDAGLQADWVEDADQADIAMRPSQARAPLEISRIQADAGFQPRFTIRDGVAALVAAG